MLTWTVGTVGALWAVGRVEQLEEFNATTLVYWRDDSLQKRRYKKNLRHFMFLEQLFLPLLNWDLPKIKVKKDGKPGQSLFSYLISWNRVVI